MLPDRVLHNLWRSLKAGLQDASFVGINTTRFHDVTPHLPFGDSEVRMAAAFIREKDMPSVALRVSLPNVVDYILLAGQNDTALFEGVTAYRSWVEIDGAQVEVIDTN